MQSECGAGMYQGSPQGAPPLLLVPPSVLWRLVGGRGCQMRHSGPRRGRRPCACYRCPVAGLSMVTWVSSLRSRLALRSPALTVRKMALPLGAAFAWKVLSLMSPWPWAHQEPTVIMRTVLQTLTKTLSRHMALPLGAAFAWKVLSLMSPCPWARQDV